jgi:hypothetical protein
MDKKILCIVICGLFITAIFPLAIHVSAGDQENPEIEDELDDTDIPSLDIESAWFYEKTGEPQFLYTALKVKLLDLKANACLSIRWSYDGKEYVSGLDTYKFQDYVFRSGDPKRASYWQWKNMPECEGTVNQSSNIITWKILKSNIGNPEKGDVLTNTRAAAVPGFPTSFIYFLIGKDVRDFAPNEQYGTEYIIQYGG